MSVFGRPPKPNRSAHRIFHARGVIDLVDAAHRAYVAIGHIVQKQAYILAFSDTFYALGAALIVAMLASLLLKKPDRLDAGGAH